MIDVPRHLDDEEDAPESGTVRDETSGNQPSDRLNANHAPRKSGANKEMEDDPSHAGEEG